VVWIRTQCKLSTVIASDPDAVRALLSDIEGCGRLMPSVHTLEGRGDDIYHYRLDAFSNGAISMTPDYETRFDTTDPAQIRWAPYGEHNFRSWGTFRTTAGPATGETVLEIDTRAEADVAIDPVLIPLVEPFARQFMREVTAGFLANIKQAVESPTQRSDATDATGPEVGAR
jgi:carbon monoxide dehydrogenase subunit G